MCSRPDLIHERVSEPGSELQHLLQLYPAGGRSTKRVRPELSGKVSVLDYLLALVKTQTSDKLVVLVSGYTRTLGLFGTLCQTRGYCLGSTAAYSCDMTGYFFWRAKYLFLSLLALPKHLPYTHN